MQGDEIPLILYRCHTLVYLSRTHPIYRSVLSRVAVPSDRTFSHMPVLISAVSRPETSALKVQSVESYKNRKTLIMSGGGRTEKYYLEMIWLQSVVHFRQVNQTADYICTNIFCEK